MKVELVRITVDPIEAMALAGSNCYDSMPTEKLIDQVYKSGHHTILEFAYVHFHIEGVSRALTHQLVRHRIATYAQRSQRYVKERNFEYVTPASIKQNPHALKIFEYCMRVLGTQYETLLELDIPGEDARFVLPNACASVIDVSMDFRSFMNFCAERECLRAQWEIRAMANKMHALVSEAAPTLSKFLGPKCERHKPHCFCTEEKSCGKYPKLRDVFYQAHLSGEIIRLKD